MRTFWLRLNLAEKKPPLARHNRHMQGASKIEPDPNNDGIVSIMVSTNEKRQRKNSSVKIVTPIHRVQHPRKSIQRKDTSPSFSATDHRESHEVDDQTTLVVTQHASCPESSITANDADQPTALMSPSTSHRPQKTLMSTGVDQHSSSDEGQPMKTAPHQQQPLTLRSDRSPVKLHSSASLQPQLSDSFLSSVSQSQLSTARVATVEPSPIKPPTPYSLSSAPHGKKPVLAGYGQLQRSGALQAEVVKGSNSCSSSCTLL